MVGAEQAVETDKATSVEDDVISKICERVYSIPAEEFFMWPENASDPKHSINASLAISDKPSAAERIARELEHQGIDAAAAMIREQHAEIARLKEQLADSRVATEDARNCYKLRCVENEQLKMALDLQ